MDNVCPYCKRVMKLGKICGQNYSIKWYPIDEKPSKFLFSKKGLCLSKSTIFETPKVENSYYCENCKKIIISM